MLKVLRLPHKVTIEQRAEIPWCPIYIAESDPTTASGAQSTTPATQSDDGTARQSSPKTTLAAPKPKNCDFETFLKGFLQGKARSPKPRKTKVSEQVSTTVTLRKAIQRKLRVLKVPRLPHKVTIEQHAKITWCPIYIAESDSAKASCAQSTTPVTQSDDPTLFQSPIPSQNTIYSTAPARASTRKSTFYYSFARSTRTILRKGCARPRQNRRFTTVSRDRHARSYERVARARAKIDVLLQFRAIDTHDSM